MKKIVSALAILMALGAVEPVMCMRQKLVPPPTPDRRRVAIHRELTMEGKDLRPDFEGIYLQSSVIFSIMRAENFDLERFKAFIIANPACLDVRDGAGRTPLALAIHMLVEDCSDLNAYWMAVEILHVWTGDGAVISEILEEMRGHHCELSTNCLLCDIYQIE